MYGPRGRNMSIPTEILLVAVAGVAFYLGYRMGRMSVLSELNTPRHTGANPEVATADAAPLPGPDSGTARPRATPPPASAGGDVRRPGAPAGAGSAPRRTATPPPARAGLIDTGKSKN